MNFNRSYFILDMLSIYKRGFGFIKLCFVLSPSSRFVQASLKTEREKKKELYFPLRKYAIKV